MDAKCIKCANTHFEIKYVRVYGTDNGLHLVACSSCQSIVGVSETNEVESQLQSIKNQLSALASRIDQSTLDQQYVFTNKISELETQLSNIKYQLNLR